MIRNRPSGVSRPVPSRNATKMLPSLNLVAEVNAQERSFAAAALPSKMTPRALILMKRFQFHLWAELY